MVPSLVTSNDLEFRKWRDLPTPNNKGTVLAVLYV